MSNLLTKHDPSRTTLLQKQFMAGLGSRYKLLWDKVIQEIIKDDILGLREPTFNHLPGKHSQKKHGRGGGSASTKDLSPKVIGALIKQHLSDKDSDDFCFGNCPLFAVQLHDSLKGLGVESSVVQLEADENTSDILGLGKDGLHTVLKVKSTYLDGSGHHTKSSLTEEWKGIAKEETGGKVTVSFTEVSDSTVKKYRSHLDKDVRGQFSALKKALEGLTINAQSILLNHQPGKHSQKSHGGGGVSNTYAPSRKEIAELEKQTDEWDGDRGYIAASALRDIEYPDKDEQNAGFVVKAGKELMGAVSYGIRPLHDSKKYKDPVIVVDWLATKSTGGGFGKTLMKKMYEEAISKDLPIMLGAATDAIPFYKKMGMQEAIKGRKVFRIEVNEMKSFLKKSPTTNKRNIDLEPLEGVFARRIEFQTINHQPGKHSQKSHGGGGGGVTITYPKDPNPSFTEEQTFSVPGGRLSIAKSKWAPADYSVTDTVVDESHRRKGIATQLIKAVRSKLKGSISAATSSDGSTELFWKQGFRLFKNPTGTLSDAKKIRAEMSSVTLIHPGETTTNAQSILLNHLPGKHSQKGHGGGAVKWNFEHESDFGGNVQEQKIGNARIVYQMQRSGNVELGSIRVPHKHRGKGEAKTAIREFLSGTDKAGKTVELLASPLDRKTNVTKLVKFYQSEGFKLTGKTNYAGEPKMVRSPSPTTNAFSFKTSSQKLKFFEQWMIASLTETMSDAEIMAEDKWWERYIRESWNKGNNRSKKETDKKRGKKKANELPGTARAFDDAPVDQQSIERLQALVSRTFTDLEGINRHAASQMTTTLSDGLIKGHSPKKIAEALRNRIDMTKARAERIARTEIVRAQAEGQLNTLELMGVSRVGVNVEWATAGDGRVCPICDSMGGKVYEVKNAHGLIPAHPNCRCAFLPVVEVTSKSVSTRKRIEQSILAAKRKS